MSGFDFSEKTVVPDSASSFVQVSRRKSRGRGKFDRVIPLDVEILRLCLAANYVRPVQVAGWTGASLGHLNQRFRVLRDFGFLKTIVVSCRIPDVLGSLGPWVPRTISAYQVTAAGRRVLEGWQLVGAPVGSVTFPPLPKPKQSLGDHTLGVVDVGVVFRRLGFGVAFEREIKNVELSSNRVGGGVREGAELSWCAPRGSGGLHVPDLGVVHPSGSRWGVELELSTKLVSDYEVVVRSMREFGLGQVWLVGSNAALVNIGKAAGRLGWPLREYSLGVGVPSVFADDSGLIRVQRFRGGFLVPSRQSEVEVRWGELVGLGVPGGFNDVGVVDRSVLRGSWAQVRG